MKYIFITGGVVSGLGKGIVSSSIGMLLKECGFKVEMVKIDPYLNVDAGTLRPEEHGETFVTDDGGETDQDMGNYERFLDQNVTGNGNITSGKVYSTIIARERAFEYKGRDVEIIPDAPNEIKKRLYEMEKDNDFMIVEVGGTTGDIENLIYLYAAREIKREREVMYVMVSYVPMLKNVGELKTKPTQQAVTNLRTTGISPDILITRNEIPIDKPRLETLAKRCFLDDDAIFDDPDCDSIYDVPLILNKQGILKKIFKHFKLKPTKPNLKKWIAFAKNSKINSPTVRVALVGKYIGAGDKMHRDVYMSVSEAVKHAAATNKVKVELVPVEAREGCKKTLEKGNFQGMIVPQGWGSRGVEGMIEAVNFARVNKMPYLGLCFGMQLAVIEYSRNVLKLKGANSEEADPKTKYPVVHIMPDQKKYLDARQYGGTIRLGSWPCLIKEKTLLSKMYKSTRNPSFDKEGVVVYERHRHRYEVNNEYREQLEKAGMKISGTSPDGKLVEAIELQNHPFFVGTQFHPEYKSRPLSPHPIFVEFVVNVSKLKS